jgi:hypothetical protein
MESTVQMQRLAYMRDKGLQQLYLLTFKGSSALRAVDGNHSERIRSELHDTGEGAHEIESAREFVVIGRAREVTVRNELVADNDGLS